MEVLYTIFIEEQREGPVGVVNIGRLDDLNGVSRHVERWEYDDN